MKRMPYKLYLTKAVALKILESGFETNYPVLNFSDDAHRSLAEWRFYFCGNTEPHILATTLCCHLLHSREVEECLWVATLLRFTFIRRSDEVLMEEHLLRQKFLPLPKYYGNFMDHAKGAVTQWLDPDSGPLLLSFHVPLLKGDDYLLSFKFEDSMLSATRPLGR